MKSVKKILKDSIACCAIDWRRRVSLAKVHDNCAAFNGRAEKLYFCETKRKIFENLTNTKQNFRREKIV